MTNDLRFHTSLPLTFTARGEEWEDSREGEKGAGGEELAKGSSKGRVQVDKVSFLLMPRYRSCARQLTNVCTSYTYRKACLGTREG